MKNTPDAESREADSDLFNSLQAQVAELGLPLSPQDLPSLLQVGFTHHTAARNLGLMRSLATFLYEQQRGKRHGQRSLPDWQRQHLRQPNTLAERFTGRTW